MAVELSRIRFLAANYSRLQGLKAIPVGLLVIFTSIWSIYNHGPTADLSLPLLAILGTILLYWLTNRYYIRAFGQVKQTASQRNRDIIVSLIFAALALLAFALDTAMLFPVSMLGLVFAASFLEYFVRARRSEWAKIFSFFPENIVAAILVLVLSLLPLFGLNWWLVLGMRSQLVALFMLIGIIIVITGISGHIRMVHALPSEGEK